MHIAISASFDNQPNTGSGQYLHGLLAGLREVAPQHRYTLLLPGSHTQGDAQTGRVEHSNVSRLTLAPPRAASISPNVAKLWFEQVALPWAASHVGADLLHVPYFAPPLLSRVPVVVSVLDVIPMLLPEYRGSAAVRAYMRLVSAAARRATHVLAISQASQRDIVRVLGIPTDRISVTPLAAGSQYSPGNRPAARAEVAARYGLSGRFVYYVGGLDARKNLSTLVRGFAAMRRAGGPEVLLAVAGRALGGDPRLFPDLDALIAAEGAQPWVRRIDVPAADNPLLYRAAELFAAPSRYEGFGLGPLEAMACGTPVIAANASSTPEVVGDAALCVAPEDPAAWATTLLRLLSDAALRDELRARGLVRAAQFSYQRTAAATIAVYQRAVAQPDQR